MRVLLIAMVGLVVAGGASAAVCGDSPNEHFCIINNGLAPPNPENVIDDLTHQYSILDVHNVDCPPGWPAGEPDAPCPSPGGPTEVEVVDGYPGWESVTHTLRVYDSSVVAVRGGNIIFLDSWDSSTVTMTGGTVWGSLFPQGFSTVTMSGGMTAAFLTQDSSTTTVSGGTVQQALQAHHSSTITLVGTSFKVDAVPVPYGDLTAQTGTLTGTLTSGDAISIVFYQGGWTEHPCPSAYPCTGTITLAAEACGDNFVEGAEQCDDGGTAPGDGCDASCEIETGWICTGEPSVCTEHILPTLAPWSQLAQVHLAAATGGQPHSAGPRDPPWNRPVGPGWGPPPPDRRVCLSSDTSPIAKEGALNHLPPPSRLPAPTQQRRPVSRCRTWQHPTRRRYGPGGRSVRLHGS